MQLLQLLHLALSASLTAGEHSSAVEWYSDAGQAALHSLSERGLPADTSATLYFNSTCAYPIDGPALIVPTDVCVSTPPPFASGGWPTMQLHVNWATNEYALALFTGADCTLPARQTVYGQGEECNERLDGVLFRVVTPITAPCQMVRHTSWNCQGDVRTAYGATPAVDSDGNPLCQYPIDPSVLEFPALSYTWQVVGTHWYSVLYQQSPNCTSGSVVEEGSTLGLCDGTDMFTCSTEYLKASKRQQQQQDRRRHHKLGTP